MALKRCIVNLVDNAIKYAGNAVITASESDHTVLISIYDSGPGISEQQLDSVFEPFFRLEISRSRKTGGLKATLTLVRQSI